MRPLDPGRVDRYAITYLLRDRLGAGKSVFSGEESHLKVCEKGHTMKISYLPLNAWQDDCHEDHGPTSQWLFQSIQTSPKQECLMLCCC